MKIDIYKSTKSGRKYISVPEGTDVTKLKFPANVDPDILTLSPFKTSLELDKNKSLISLDQENLIKQIEEKGFAIHGAKIEITINAV